MNRATRMGLGLIAIIPVLALTGALLRAIGTEGELAAWIALAVAALWIVLVTWWTLRAPARLSTEERHRYLAFLRHPRYEPLDDTGRRTDASPR